MWTAVIWVLTGLWAGYVLGQLSSHWWYFNHYRRIMKRRFSRPSKVYDSTSMNLAKEAETRIKNSDRRPPASNARFFALAVVTGVAAFLRKYILES